LLVETFNSPKRQRGTWNERYRRGILAGEDVK